MEEEIMENTLYFGRKTEFSCVSQFSPRMVKFLCGNTQISERPFTSVYKITGFGSYTDYPNRYIYYFESEEAANKCILKYI